jgi:hypothetical protein
MTSEKKPWSQPQLIVLGRGAPEEAVLFNCKAASFGSSSNAHHGSCKGNSTDAHGACTGACTGVVTS